MNDSLNKEAENPHWQTTGDGIKSILLLKK